jgi:hypothetical protein
MTGHFGPELRRFVLAQHHQGQVSLAPARVATEDALWVSIAAHRLLRDAVIVSDDAGQFDVGRHLERNSTSAYKSLCRIRGGVPLRC